MGIDLGKAVLENLFLNEAYCCDAAQMPIADASFDIAFSDYVFEHLAQSVLPFQALRLSNLIYAIHR